MQTLALTLAASLAIAVVFGTDVFFTVVGRSALARASASGVLEVMGHLHAVADRRMPLFGATALVATALLAVVGGQGRIAFAVSLAAQLLWLVLYTSVAKPINARMTSGMGNGISPAEARSLQTRWESILVPRTVLLTIALGSLLLALAKVG